MLSIPFSHRFFAKHFEVGGLPVDAPTRLLNYAVVHRLSDEFLRYDATFWPDGYGIALDVQLFDLGRRGPWLILFLASATGNALVGDSRYTPGWLHWTTVRRPWRRAKRLCDNCALLAGPEDMGCLGRADHGPCQGWLPKVPAKYRRARGQLVKIVYRPGGKA